MRLTSKQVNELREQSKDDRAIIVGSDIRGLCDLADAYLAENQADSGEPITEEWLHSEAGFSLDQWNTMRLEYLNLRMAFIDGVLILEMDVTEFPGVKRRGQFRRLCRALGVFLKEQP